MEGLQVDEKSREVVRRFGRRVADQPCAIEKGCGFMNPDHCSLSLNTPATTTPPLPSPVRFIVYLSKRYASQGAVWFDCSVAQKAKNNFEGARCSALNSMVFSSCSIHCMNFGVPSFDLPPSQVWDDLVKQGIAPETHLEPADTMGTATPEGMGRMIQQAEGFLLAATRQFVDLRSILADPPPGSSRSDFDDA